MEYGFFMQPAAQRRESIGDVIEQSLETIELAEELGFSEVWHGEHLTLMEEPIPACDLVLARAMERTNRIRLCTGGYVLPYYHPAALAMRIVQMDHMLKDRFICGVAAGSVPTDVAMVTGKFDPPTFKATTRAMLQESVDIMEKLWTSHVGEKWTYEGQFWTVENPSPLMELMGPHLEPYHKPMPPMAIAGTSPNSETLRFAGERGMIPLSFSFNCEFIKTHWDSVSEGAASTGRVPSRADWRIARETFVAESDAEAKAWVMDGFMGQHWNKFNIPLARDRGWIKYLKGDVNVPDDDVDVKYLVDNVWLVGSPDTVLERLLHEYDETGGFGTLLVTYYGGKGDSAAYARSLALLMSEVAPRFEKLRPAAMLSRKVDELATMQGAGS
jgi:alkanesulfonate monooxygenase SsuD/methylene tetrahydromethanopterin reductase-like flavin-dependent oxidoreductase (luciferase family)